MLPLQCEVCSTLSPATTTTRASTMSRTTAESSNRALWLGETLVTGNKPNWKALPMSNEIKRQPGYSSIIDCSFIHSDIRCHCQMALKVEKRHNQKQPVSEVVRVLILRLTWWLLATRFNLTCLTCHVCTHWLLNKTTRRQQFPTNQLNFTNTTAIVSVTTSAFDSATDTVGNQRVWQTWTQLRTDSFHDDWIDDDGKIYSSHNPERR